MPRDGQGGEATVLFLGDIFGAAGRRAVHELLPGVLRRHRPAICVANGENVAAGLGFTPPLAEGLLAAGIDVLTGGNHTWRRREAIPYLDACPRVIRPANYPEGTPGRGWGVFPLDGGGAIGILNLVGRVFMDPVGCPFRAADEAVAAMRRRTPVILVDMHAEATSEKIALARYLDGRVSAVIGTHTHVPTADAAILPGGTATITDAGMTGPYDSVIGVESERIVERFLTGLPIRFAPSEGDPRLSGVLVAVDRASGRALRIEVLHERVDDPAGEG